MCFLGNLLHPDVQKPTAGHPFDEEHTSRTALLPCMLACSDILTLDASTIEGRA